MSLETLIYYAVAGVGMLLLVDGMGRFADWLAWRIHKKELKATEDEDDQDLVLMFDGAMREQYLHGIAVGSFGVATVTIIFISPTVWGLLSAAVFAFLPAIKFVKGSRSYAGRDRERLKEYIDRNYIPSSIALREVVREAAQRGVLGPGLGESEEEWAKSMHLDK